VLVQLRGDPLPPVALVTTRCEAAADPGDHLHVGVPELARDELLRGACTHGADGVEVSRVVEWVVRQHERPQPLAVDLPHLPAVETAEEPPPTAHVKM
jgi:hypothetical protein